MGMDISNGNAETRHFHRSLWIELLKLAYEYNWKPAGTEIGGWEDPEHPHSEFTKQLERKSWNGNYTSNDGQLITAEDANAIADALEKAFEDVPHHRCYWGEKLVDYFRAGALRIF